MIVPSQAVAVDQRPNKSEHQGGEGDQVAEGTPESLRWRGRATFQIAEHKAHGLLANRCQRKSAEQSKIGKNQEPRNESEHTQIYWAPMKVCPHNPPKDSDEAGQGKKQHQTIGETCQEAPAKRSNRHAHRRRLRLIGRRGLHDYRHSCRIAPSPPPRFHRQSTRFPLEIKRIARGLEQVGPRTQWNRVQPLDVFLDLFVSPEDSIELLAWLHRLCERGVREPFCLPTTAFLKIKP